MQKKLKNRIRNCFVLLFALIMVATSVALPVSAQGSAQFTLSTDKAVHACGDEMSLYVYTNSFQAAGLYATLEYDTNVFKLVKTTVADGTFSGLQVGMNAGKLVMIWTVDENIQIPELNGAGAAIRFQFKISDSAQLKSYDFKMNVVELSDQNVKPVPYDVNNTSVTIQSPTISDAVKEVIRLIDDIPNDESGNPIGVTATDACYKKIQAALEAYTKLTGAEKKQVTNLDDLMEYNQTYQKKKEEQLAQENMAKLQAEIEKFKTDHAALLNKAPEKGTISDWIAVNDAIKEYNQKIGYVKTQLKAEQEHLLKIKDYVGALIEEADAKEAAKTMVADFLETYKFMLATKPENLPYDTEVKNQIETAILIYEDVLNTYAQDELKEEYQHLLKLRERHKELEIENAPEPEDVILAYNAFREKYLSLLSKSQEELTSEDYDKISEALSEYYELPNAVKGKLATEFEQLIGFMYYLDMGGVDDFLDDSFGDDLEDDTDVEKVEYIQVGANLGKISLTADAKLGKRFIWMFALLGIAVFLCGVSVASYIVIRKKRSKEVA